MFNRCNVTPDNITQLQGNEIFVFGSNMNGAHMGGAARIAMRWGAIMGNAIGIQGNTYALPTMNENIEPLPIPAIQNNIDTLHSAIKDNSKLHFLVTKVACGIAGYSVQDIAPMFKDFLQLPNCSLPIEFINILCPGWSSRQLVGPIVVNPTKWQSLTFDLLNQFCNTLTESQLQQPINVWGDGFILS